MTERVGVCQQCNARFKIPASFQGTQAKCNKCGGVVVVGAAAPAAAAPKVAAPSAKPAAPAAKAGAPKAAAAAPAGSRAARPAAGGRNAGARGARTRPGRAGRDMDDAPAKNNNAMFIGIGVAVIAIGVAVIMFMTKGDDKPIVPVASATTAPADAKPVESAPEVAPAPVTPTDVAPPVDAPKDEPKVEAPKVEPTPQIDASSPVLKVEPMFGKLPESSDEQWTAIQDAVKKVFLESAKPKERSAAKKVLDEAGLAIMPALMNAMNGLDVSNDIDLGKVNAIVMRIQETTHNVMGVALDGDAAKIQENLANNIKQSNKLITAWRKYDGEAGVAQFEKLKEKVAAAAEGESEGG
ncbi:MAG: hypothetical protein IPH13_13530 [Planctomycetes bacterium]|nr:hypothetical protein [Planctomycetota bacterium]MCC7172002.1 hypothetical protein [Planctomycetota bacterium]